MEVVATMGDAGFYAPMPQLTFLVDRTTMQCHICVVELKLGPPGEHRSVHTPAMYPCGHIACYRCLKQWAATKRGYGCPFCKATFEHAECKHPCKFQCLDNQNILRFPPTLPTAAGRVLDRCRDCRLDKAKTHLELWIKHTWQPDFDKLRAGVAKDVPKPSLPDDRQALKREMETLATMSGALLQQAYPADW